MPSHAPRVFISYTHDSAEHKLRVLELANRLREDGLDAWIDRYVQFPEEGWPRWMQRQVDEADTIILVCTEAYKRRFQGNEVPGKGLGATWEGLFVTQLAYEEFSKNATRFVPVLFGDTSPETIPLQLRPFTFFRLPDEYEALYRVLTHQPETPIPPVGKVKDLAQRYSAVTPQRLPVVSTGADRDVHPGTDGSSSIVTDSRTSPAVPWADSNEQALVVLRERWKSRRLTLLLGAGVSAASGLPLWDELLGDLLADYVQKTYAGTFGDKGVKDIRTVLQEEFRRSSPIQVAEFFQARTSATEFSASIQQALYRRHKEGQATNQLLQAIVNLYPGLHSVVSFNFDDLLESALRTEGLEFTPVIGGPDLARISGLPVYHPHGYLPRLGDPSAHIVFAESDYHTQYADSYSWTNIVVQRLLLESTCLIVGSSLTDPNMRRMIDLAHRQNVDQRHFYVTLAPRYTEDRLRLAVSEVLQASYEAKGLTPIWLRTHKELPSILDRIRGG